MDDLAALHDMALFVEVARASSFSRAAARLGVPGATLSRRIAALERRFGVRLFDRTTRKVELTDAGRRHLERCGELVDRARVAHELLRDAVEEPSGHVRVSMPVDLGVEHVAPLLPAFARRHPNVTIEFDLSPTNRDLVGERVDLAIRIGAVQGERLVVRRIGMVDMSMFAAPGYLKHRGQPQQPADLAGHECLTVPRSPRTLRWALRQDVQAVEVEVHGRFAANNLSLLRVLAEGGLGIAVLPNALARDAVRAGRLVQVLHDWSLPRLPVHAVMSSRLQPASVRVFVDLLVAQLSLS